VAIAAITYYAVSLLLYGGKAANAAGVPIHSELAAGAAMPPVLWGVWQLTRRIHGRLQGHLDRCARCKDSLGVGRVAKSLCS
jgi:uncharacterized membrane-anchored protein